MIDVDGITLYFLITVGFLCILGWQHFLYRRKKAQLEQALEVQQILLKTIFDIFPVGISITDPEGNIIECNRASEMFLGISKEEHLKRHYAGQEWHIRRADGTEMPPEEYASVRALKTGQSIFDVEMEVVRPSKSVWLLVSAIPLTLPGYGVLICYIDISALKKIQFDLSSAKNTAESLNKAKTQFLIQIEHELRTPLNVIIGLANRAIERAESPASEHVVHSLQKIEQAGLVINQLLKEMTSFSSLQKLEKNTILNIQQAMNALEITPAFYLNLAHSFCELHQNSVEELHFLLKDQNWTALKLFVHSLKSEAAHLGAFALRDIATECDLAIKENNLDRALSLAPELEKTFQTTLSALRLHLLHHPEDSPPETVEEKRELASSQNDPAFHAALIPLGHALEHHDISARKLLEDLMEHYPTEKKFLLEIQSALFHFDFKTAFNLVHTRSYLNKTE